MSSAVDFLLDPFTSNNLSGDDFDPEAKKAEVAKAAADAQAAADLAARGPQAMPTRDQTFSNTFSAGGITTLGGQANMPGVSTLAGPKKRAASRALVGG